MKFNNKSLRIAINEWFVDSLVAEKKYGHISKWDISEVNENDPYYKKTMLIIRSEATMKELQPKNFNLSCKTKINFDYFPKILEKKVNPLPSNFSNLSSCEQEELLSNRFTENKNVVLGNTPGLKIHAINKQTESNSVGEKYIKVYSGDKVNPETKLSFFEWVVGILAVLFFLWLFSQDVDVGGGGVPMRR